MTGWLIAASLVATGVGILMLGFGGGILMAWRRIEADYRFLGIGFVVLGILVYGIHVVLVLTGVSPA
jgi:hypothetical protein